jgi:hypothetical protein
MVRLLFALVLALTAACAPAGRGRDSTSVLRVKPPVWEFGTLERGETWSTTVVIGNAGEVPVEISLFTTCDCLRAEMEPESVPAGGTATVTLKYTGGEIKDRVTKTLYLDPVPEGIPRLSVTATGKVTPGRLPHLVVVPSPLAVEAGSTDRGEIELSNAGAETLVVSGIRYFGCSGAWTETIIESGERMPLPLELLPGWQGKRWVEIESNDPVTPTVKVSIIEI